MPGDIVLADHGSNIADSVGMYKARLHIPAFTKGKNKLTPLEVEETQSIANVWIHVERDMYSEMVRQKYTILQGTLPIYLYVITRTGEDYPTIDRIIYTLCNLCDSVVPFD